MLLKIPELMLSIFLIVKTVISILSNSNPTTVEQLGNQLEMIKNDKTKIFVK